MEPDAVLFDLDDTLCRYRRSGASLLVTAFESTGLDPFVSSEEYYGRYPEFIDGSDSMVDLRERCFATIAAEKGYDPEDGRRIARAYADERDHRNVERVPGVDRVLSALSEVPVGVVTNGAPGMQAQKLDALGLADAFDVVVHAGYDAPAKPSPEPFDAALSAMSARAERSYHVGNSLRTDVAGANAAGLRSVWVPEGPGDRSPDPKPAHVLPELDRMPDVLSLE
ncbi:HAD family hydrolase [Natronomonas sp. LN261]|uniref:HAD family hydrolase n=1 Tax=Natronomonas sp. LN261 TaxID=2750669 RepID=UPI0015EEE5DA|nr:HAD family hydrolase [Natronomonas sp. LN261]